MGLGGKSGFLIRKVGEYFTGITHLQDLASTAVILNNGL